jgi:Tfp pilus assembly protein PilV
MELDRRPRTALTVVEVLVALVLVSVGLLGMAGSSALALRTAATAVRERRAIQRASTRIAILSAAGCARATSGALDDRATGMHERWTVGVPRQGMAMIEAHVEWPAAGGPRSFLLRSALLC